VSLAYASTLADVGAVVAAVATLGLLGAAIWAGVSASGSLGEVREQSRVQHDQLGELQKQLRLQRQSAQRDRVYELLSQLFKGDFIRMSLVAEALFQENPPDAGGWRACWEARTREERSMITTVMNFYEVVASEYNSPDQLDRQVANRSLIPVADGMWRSAAGLVEWMRTLPGGERDYWDWEQMHKSFSRAMDTGEGSTDPSEPIRRVEAIPASPTETAK
jgi:hypothetical protein